MTDSADQKVIQDFYSAFGRHDGDAMAGCYHPDVVFRDPAFGELHGQDACDMWRMLTRISKDLRIEVSGVTAAGGKGRAHWDAYYTFTATRRHVHNSIDAKFEFKDGLIYRHTDQFDFNKWAAQAFGPFSKILAPTPVLPYVVNRNARKSLQKFQAKQRQLSGKDK